MTHLARHDVARYNIAEDVLIHWLGGVQMLQTTVVSELDEEDEEEEMVHVRSCWVGVKRESATTMMEIPNSEARES